MPPPKRRVDLSPRGGSQKRNGARVATALPPSRVERTSRTSRPSGGTSLASLEILAWVAVACVALGIRLINLDGNPLQPSESVLAMESWRVVQDEGVAIGPSALLIYANALLFLVLGATDAVARALPAIAGAAVALSPVLLRRRLGRIGSLAAAATMATSGTLVLASRLVDPTILSVALGLAIVIVVDRKLGSTRASYLYGGGVIAALLLISGPLAYDFLIILVGFAVVYGGDSIRAAGLLPDLKGRAARDNPSPTTADDHRDSARGGALPLTSDGSGGTTFENDWSVVETDALPAGHRGGPLTGVVVAFGLTVILDGTGLLTNLTGLGESLASPLAAWAGAFSGFSPHPAWLYPALVLGYEPLALAFGIVGAVIAFRESRAFEVFLTWWACIGFLLLVLSNGADPLWNALIVVPLALLAGTVVERLPAKFLGRERFQRLAVFCAVVCPLISTSLIAFGYVTLPQPVIPQEVALAPPLAILAFLASYAFGYDVRTALYSTAALAAGCLLLFNVHAALLLNPGYELNPAELFVSSVTSADVRTMATDVKMTLDELQIARQIEGRDVSQTVEVAAPFADPVAWYLRDQPGVRVVTRVDDSPAIAIVASSDKAPRGAYAGEQFQYSVSAPRPGLSPGTLWRWWMYHETSGRSGTYVKVYVKTQLARSDGGGS